MPENLRDIQEGVSSYIRIGTSIFLVLALLFIAFVSMAAQKRKRMLHQQQLMKTAFEKELLETKLEIQEQTLRTISQEIHDNVGQVLSLAKLNLNTLDMNAGDKQEKINRSIELVSKAINDLRDLSRSINGDKLSELGLQDAIDNELKILQNTGQFSTSLEVTGQPFELSPRQEIVLFRIVQESLNNILKHSNAKTITVKMHFNLYALVLKLTDDGNGFDPNHSGKARAGIGLANMRNRAALIEAVFSIHSSPGKGTTIQLETRKQS